MSNTPSSDPTDQTPLVSSSEISPSDVPEYERPTASGVSLSEGNVPKAIAYSTGGDTTNIKVGHPEMYTAGVQAHELQHMVQKNAGSEATGVSTQTTGEQGMYDYGGTEGLAKHLASGKTVSDLNAEQQASIPHNYMKEYVKAEKSGDAKALDKLNSTYEPAIRQLRNMANSSKDTINTTPDAPGAPPAALTGLAKALPGMYSKSTASAALKGSDVHNPPPKKPSTKTSPAVYNGASKVMSGGKKKS